MRKIFWNARESFFGANFLTFIPKNYLIFPVLAGVPTYTFVVLQSGSTYYDEYDGDVAEKPKQH